MPFQTLSELDPEGLEAYFTDVEHLRDLFKTSVAAPILPKRLLVIHGVGGVGKSSLLRMFRLHCKKEGVPVALASGDEAKSAVDVLTGWANDLKVDGLKLSTFAKTTVHYRAIQARVETEVHKAKEIRNNAAGALGKAAAKTVVETVVSAIPVVGPLISGLSGVGAETLVDWLSSFLKKPDIDLLLDPTKALTTDLLADLDRVASKRRLVLMLDTFEQLSTLEDWVREFAQRLHPNILLVVAGRAVPNWSRQWSGWLAQAEVQELKPMNDTIMRELVNRYYATMRGGVPTPAQVESILAFARGLPIVVTSAVRLWVQYGVEDFQTVKPQVVADLVDRMLEGVPPELIPILEAAAVVRWFNKDILRAITAQIDISTIYDELRRFPFTRPRIEGLALHDAVREIIDENIHVHDPVRHHKLHEQAMIYFESKLVEMSSAEGERLGLERLYHCTRIDEKEGIRLFQEIAEELTRYRLANRLQALLNDVNTYPLEEENNRLWRTYYNARLAHLEARLEYAEKEYQRIGQSNSAEPKLQAYALCDWGGILRRREYVRKPGGEEKAIHVLGSCLEIDEQIDIKVAVAWTFLSDVYIANADWNNAIFYLDKAREFFTSHNDYIGMIEVTLHEQGIYGRQGNFRKLIDTQQRRGEIFKVSGEPAYLKARCRPPIDWLWIGRYFDLEKEIRPGLESVRSFQDEERLNRQTRELGLTLAVQGKCSEALPLLEESVAITRRLGDLAKLEEFLALGFLGAGLFRCGNLDKAEEYLLEALKTAKKIHAHLDAAPLFLATLYQASQNLESAEHFYHVSLAEANQIGRTYYKCGALTGLVRVKYAQSDYPTIPPLLNEAEQLAQQYEYNDHLASLRLTQGHIAWEGQIADWGRGFDAAFGYYQQVLIYALRFNRFLLDEVLWGGGVFSPLRPIIPHCRERGEEGRKMLTALRDWWQTGANNTGTPCKDTISPIPEDIPLLEAEQLARKREPGDGSTQQSVLEQLEIALNG